MSDETVTVRVAMDTWLRLALWLGILAEEADAGAAIPASQRRDLLAALEHAEAQARVVRAVIARLR